MAWRMGISICLFGVFFSCQDSLHLLPVFIECSAIIIPPDLHKNRAGQQIQTLLSLIVDRTAPAYHRRSVTRLEGCR